MVRGVEAGVSLAMSSIGFGSGHSQVYSPALYSAGPLATTILAGPAGRRGPRPRVGLRRTADESLLGHPSQLITRSESE